jgi:hypothetical protein
VQSRHRWAARRRVGVTTTTMMMTAVRQPCHSHSATLLGLRADVLLQLAGVRGAILPGSPVRDPWAPMVGSQPLAGPSRRRDPPLQTTMMTTSSTGLRRDQRLRRSCLWHSCCPTGSDVCTTVRYRPDRPSVVRGLVLSTTAPTVELAANYANGRTCGRRESPCGWKRELTDHTSGVLVHVWSL